jgi:hypothetical protein
MVAYEKLKESDPFDDGVGPGFANQVPACITSADRPVSQIAQSVYNFDTRASSRTRRGGREDRRQARLEHHRQSPRLADLHPQRRHPAVPAEHLPERRPALRPAVERLRAAEEVNSGVFQLNSTWTDNFSTELRAQLPRL